MFPKGPRFPATKVSEVPGPNHYDVTANSLQEAYKHGAFLENAERFIKDKHGVELGPGTYNTDAPDKKNTSNSKQDSGSLTLQRKMDAMEKQFAESKKTYKTEIERLKLDLARTQRSYSELSEHFDKQKKHADHLEARIQDYRKSSASDQCELKDLRSKLKILERERMTTASKQEEVGELKKTLQALESRRKEELREKDARAAELEKLHLEEQRRRQAIDIRLVEMKGKDDNSKAIQRELKKAQELLEDVRNAADVREKELVSLLQQNQAMLSAVAQEYGNLASSCVSANAHAHLKQEKIALQLRSIRLERKFANSESQISELAHLIRSIMDRNILLTQSLLDCHSEIQHYTLRIPTPLSIPDHLELELLDAVQELHAFETAMEKSRSEIHSSCADIYLNSCHTMTSAYLEAEDSLHSLLLQFDHEEAKASAALKSCEEHKRARYESEDRMDKLRIERQKERNAVLRLTGIAQKSKVAEDGLKVEVAQLTNELAMAARYEEAYNALYAEAEALIARNELAETEAERLSKINAEIIGHANPAQRIMYLEKIRGELAETKQRLLIATKERGLAVDDNGKLRNELELYKSVAIPVEDKPRTAITRVARAPLVNLNTSHTISSIATSNRSTSSSVKKLDSTASDILEGFSKIDEVSHGWSIAEEDINSLSGYLPDEHDMTLEELTEL